MDTFYERLSKLVDDQAKGKYTVFAKKAGIPISTFQSYMRDRMPHAEHLIRICVTYNINLNWLLMGDDEPYKGGKGLKSQAPEDDLEILKLLEGARKVLKSGNKVAHEALEAGIRYFSQTVDALENLKENNKRQKNMESRMATLETRLKKSEEIRNEDPPEQQDEILKLRAG